MVSNLKLIYLKMVNRGFSCHLLVKLFVMHEFSNFIVMIFSLRTSYNICSSGDMEINLRLSFFFLE